MRSPARRSRLTAKISDLVRAQVAPAVPQGVAKMASWRQSRPVWMIVPTLLFCQIAAALETNMIYAATPAMSVAFRSPTGAAWVPTAALVVGAASAAVCGRLGDLYGRRRILMFSLALTTAGSVLSSCAPNLGWVIAGGALQGLIGSVTGLTVALICEKVPPERVAWSIGIVASGASLAAAVGLLLGGFLVDSFGWQAIFVATAVWNALCFVMVRLFVPLSADTSLSKEGVDYFRGLLFVPAISCILISLNFVKLIGWSDPRILGPMVVSIIVLIYWANVQLRADNPVINVRILKHPMIAMAFVCIMLLGVGTFQQNLIISLMLQQPAWTAAGVGLSAAAAGAVLMAPKLAGIGGSVAGGKITAYVGAANVLALGSAMTAIGWLIIVAWPGRLEAIIIGMIIEGAGLPMCYNAISMLLVQTAPTARAGEMTGLQAVCRSIASACGIQILMLFLATSSETSPEGVNFPSLSAYQAATWFIIIASVLCGLLAARVHLVPRAKAY